MKKDNKWDKKKEYRERWRKMGAVVEPDFPSVDKKKGRSLKTPPLKKME